MGMLGLNARYVGGFHGYEAMRNWFDRGCNISNCQVHTFEIWSIAALYTDYSSASGSLNWLGTRFHS